MKKSQTWAVWHLSLLAAVPQQHRCPHYQSTTLASCGSDSSKTYLLLCMCSGCLLDCKPIRITAVPVLFSKARSHLLHSQHENHDCSAGCRMQALQRIFFLTQQKRWPQISLQNREKSYLSGHWGRIIIRGKIRIKSTSKNREAASPLISISPTWRHYFATIFFTRCCFGFTGLMWLSNRSPHPKLNWPERTSLILLPHFECLFRIQCFFRYSFNMHFSKVLSAVNIADQG